MYSIGLDIGSSSVKGAIINANNEVICNAKYPDMEMTINTPELGYAEQDPEAWWEAVCKVIRQLLADSKVDPKQIASIGIGYQMHGLVMVDKDQKVLYPAIIWCDSRAVNIGKDLTAVIGESKCYETLLNSVGNFTASKLQWVKRHRTEIYAKIYKIMLPGDYIAMRMSGEITTTVSGLSEGMFWDFKVGDLSEALLEASGFERTLFPDIVPTFGHQVAVNDEGSKATGLSVGTPITYRAGDQPNNALALGVVNDGQIAATCGTSGVVYAVMNKLTSDPQSRINSFAHVNHTNDKPSIGQLLCINGAGNQYAWLRREVMNQGTSYDDMEEMSSTIPIGAEGLRVLPFGNGAERMLNNQEVGSHFCHIALNRHTRSHMIRAVIEGIAFAFVYGIDILKSLGLTPNEIRVGNDNLFQSKIFSQTIANLTLSTISVYETNGAEGAARGSMISLQGEPTKENIANVIDEIPLQSQVNGRRNEEMVAAYERWKEELEGRI